MQERQYCNYLKDDFKGFRPLRHVAPIIVKFARAWVTEGPLPYELPNLTLIWPYLVISGQK